MHGNIRFSIYYILNDLRSTTYSYLQIILPNSDLSKASQESLMNDFLMIDFMQKDIIEILMNKIKILAVDWLVYSL